jgi:predicted transporter
MSSIAPLVLPLLVGIVFASATSKIAGRKGRSPVTWGVLGFFFGIFAVVAAWIAPKKQAVAG